MPNGTKFSNVQEMKKGLLDYESALAEQFVKSLLSYGLGRTMEFSDSNNVESILKKLKINHYRVRDMIKEIANSSLMIK